MSISKGSVFSNPNQVPAFWIKVDPDQGQKIYRIKPSIIFFGNKMLYVCGLREARSLPERQMRN
jgi:hypothetical protein